MVWLDSPFRQGNIVKATIVVLAGLAIGSGVGGAQAQDTSAIQHVQTDAAPIATAVWAKGLLFVSGQTASPIAQTEGSKQGDAAYGDTKTQTISIFHKIDDILKSQDLALKDVVSMRVYLVGVPAQGGQMDFAGFQAGYAEFFGNPSQKLKPARATVQVAALAHSWSLVEVEVIAARERGRRATAEEPWRKCFVPQPSRHALERLDLFTAFLLFACRKR
jgi:enamine deaminase RidA (YjgF/YER057c/UK114 family)